MLSDFNLHEPLKNVSDFLKYIYDCNVIPIGLSHNFKKQERRTFDKSLP